MLRVIVIKKFRDTKGKIYGYRIKDEHNRINDIRPDQLKHAIREHTIECINLSLTSDNRLINKKVDTYKNNIENRIYYRYTIWNTRNNEYIGGLFRGINRVLDDINEEAENGNDLAIEDYEDLNRIEGQLEYILKFPNITNKKAIFYFEEQMRNRIIDRINKMKLMMNDYGYDIKEEIIKNPHESKIIYRDQDQIALLN